MTNTHPDSRSEISSELPNEAPKAGVLKEVSDIFKDFFNQLAAIKSRQFNLSKKVKHVIDEEKIKNIERNLDISK